jgi:hypothetical protein
LKNVALAFVAGMTSLNRKQPSYLQSLWFLMSNCGCGIALLSNPSIRKENACTEKGGLSLAAKETTLI